jgi:hypothetical protein
MLNDPEFIEIVQDIPIAQWSNLHTVGVTARISIMGGKLNIFPASGGWLGCKLSDLEADIAPFSD